MPTGVVNAGAGGAGAGGVSVAPTGVVSAGAGGISDKPEGVVGAADNGVEPAGVVGAGVANNCAAGKPICLVCHQELDPTAPEQIYTPPCAHPAHELCITTYARAKCIPLHLACPMKCLLETQPLAEAPAFSVGSETDTPSEVLDGAEAETVMVASDHEAPINITSRVPSNLIALADVAENAALPLAAKMNERV